MCTWGCPLLQFVQGEKWATMTSIAYDAAVAQEFAGRTPWGLAILSALVSVMACYAIFKFKNRRLQIKWTNTCLLLTVAWYATAAAYVWSRMQATGFETIVPKAGLALPAISLICLWLARRGIKKDEALVRAADRIR
ncbi:MAG: DUF4293 domain-containing protein [Bacteroidales bacterium]|nr:DUF4293 domain-containing protein [Bacteroidales bacterium]